MTLEHGQNLGKGSDSAPQESKREPRRGLVAVAFGQEGLKAVDGKIQKAIPFVGADHPGEFSSFGIGVVLPENGNRGQIWGLAMPHMLIQSWRAMKLLEHVEVIEHGTLCATWYAGSREPHSSDQHYIDGLAAKVGEDKFRTLRTRILDEVPTSDEVTRMLTDLRDNEVEVSSWELKREVEEGRLAPNPLIDELVAEDERRHQEYLRREEESKRPLPAEQSLAALFQQLGIQNMIIGGGFGAYGMDWGHIELDKLEESIRRNSHYSDRGEPLQRTTQAPRTWRTDVTPGMSMYQTETGEIENPSVKTSDGTTYTFTSAKFADGSFAITTRVQPKDGEPQEAEYTVPQLREMLAEKLQPQKQTLGQRILRTIRRSN